MNGDKTLSMSDAQQKLADLKQSMPHANDPMVAFGRFMAGRLNNYLTPEEFAESCERALYDLVTGVDSHTQQKIECSLIGYSPMIFALLRMEVPGIAESVFPAQFASDVKIAMDRMSVPVKRSSHSTHEHAR